MSRSWMPRLFCHRDLPSSRNPLAVEPLEDRLIPAVVPLSQAFLTQAYSDLLNRPIDPTGLAAWTAYLTTHDRVSAALQIETSQELRALEVDQLYASLLHRAPESAGQQFWMDFLTHGQPLQVAASIVGSSEYFTQAGSTTSGFINALYQDALGRLPDPQGSATIQHALDAGIDRGTIAKGVFTSTEYLNNLVAGYYPQYLHR